MQIIHLNAKDYKNTAEIHEFLKNELDFPAYYGGNLDALHDALTQICKETKIIMDLTGAEDRAIRTIAEVIKDAGQENRYLKVEEQAEGI